MKTYDLNAIKAIPIATYLKDRGISVKGNRCAAAWRNGDNSQAVSISRDKNLWFDFVEGEGGTIIDLAMKVEGLAFAQARLELAKRYGIRQTDVPTNAPAPKPPPQPDFIRVAWAVTNKDISQLDETDLPAAERVVKIANGATDEATINDAVAKVAAECRADNPPTSAPPRPTGTRFEELYSQRKRLGDFADPIPDDDNPMAIFKDKYLRRGQMLLIVSTLGVGKSTFVSQGSECWARGLPFMGFVPTRPLLTSVFETEDDGDEIADFRNNFSKGFKRDGWTDLEIAEAESGATAPIYYKMGGVQTSSFLDYLNFCTERDKPDIVIINPAYDFIEGDFSKAEDVSQWKTSLLEIAERNRFAVIVVHHTNKVPTNAKERTNWCTGTSAAYAGSGSMVLPSSARAVVFIRPLEKKSGLFEIVAAKRGKRLGWRDAEGNPTTIRYAAHTDDIIFWRNATAAEVNAVASKPDGEKKRLPKGVQRVIDLCTANKVPFDSVAAYRKAAMGKYEVSDTSADNWLNAAIDDGRVMRKPVEGRTYVGLVSQFYEEE